MLVNDRSYRTIWPDSADPAVTRIIDQRFLPHRFVIEELRTVDDFCRAIAEMHVRGAGLIGATAGFAMHAAALAAPDHGFDQAIQAAANRIIATRPTAANLAWAVRRQQAAMGNEDTPAAKRQAAFTTACAIADEDAEFCRRIGEHGVAVIEEAARRKNGQPVNILTHCNAGWLAFVDYGSATAPVYEALRRGIPVHVWVDETRPWLQGARLTAWELGQQGVPYTVVTDNAGGHLMQHGLVDLCLVGTDRVSRCGDVANKIGTYLKALAAYDNGIPFYVALPSSTFDWQVRDGVREIPIEERSADEIHFVAGATASGEPAEVRITPPDAAAANYGFDVTPARLVTGLITERGIVAAREEAITVLFPEAGQA